MLSVVIPAAADATLYDGSGVLANGSGEHLFAGVTNHAEVRRCLLRFDASAALPANAHVVAAEVRLTIDRTFYFAPLAVSLHRVHTAWSEGASNPTGGEGGGANAAPGDVTWFHASLPAVGWNVPGGDFDPTPSAVCTTPDQWIAVTWPTSLRLVDDVQAWLDTPASNHGWLLRTAEVQGGAIRRFSSRSNPATADRPSLRVDYVLPGAWGTVGTGCGSTPPSIGLSGTFLPATSAGVVVQGTSANTFAVTFVALGLSLPGIALFPGCAVMLDPASSIALTAGVLDAAGQLAGTVAIPAAPSFTGHTLTAQAVLDVATAPGLELSRAAIALLP